MKALAGFFIVSLGVVAWGQPRGGFVNSQPFVQGTFGNAVFPGGTSAIPGIHRTFGNAAFPSGAGFPRLVVPGSVTDPTFLIGGPGPRRSNGRGTRFNNAVVVPYAVPVYADGFYDNPYLQDSVPPPAPIQQQPNIVVVYPPMQSGVMAPSPGNDNAASSGPADTARQQPARAEEAPPEPQHYLIAFKDHTIYAAVAFWVDGDTLHYFTSGNTHNQVSLSLVDKALTERLNKESGIEMRLPQ